LRDDGLSKDDDDAVAFSAADCDCSESGSSTDIPPYEKDIDFMSV
jgi:hypothetical protein